MRQAICALVLLMCLAPWCNAQATIAQTQTAIIVDFENKASARDANLVRLATDTVAVELSNSGQFVVLAREEVRRESERLNFRPPYDSIALEKLSRALGATAYVTGEISFIRVTEKKGVRMVEVGLKVRVHDSDSGELIAGAAVVGSATGRSGQTSVDSLTREALRAAASRKSPTKGRVKS